MAAGDRGPVFAALLAAMRPLASLLLRFGIGYRDFSDVCKMAFIQAATDEFGIRGRPTNISRVAAMTGLTRKEVSRVRTLGLAATLPPPRTRNAPAEVLHTWHTDPRFCVRPGIPRPLPWAGADVSFSALVRAVAGDLPPGAVRAELRRVGAIDESSADAIRATRRYYVPETPDELLIEGLEFALRPLLLTVLYNITAPPDARLRFQRLVDSRKVPVVRRPDVEQFLHQRLSAVTEEIDNYFASLEDDSADGDGVNLGVGLFFFEEPAAHGNVTGPSDERRGGR
jgi:hypothetical protein